MRLLLACLLGLILALPLRAETEAEVLSANVALVEKPSRQTIGPVIAALAQSGDPAAATVLQAWEAKGLGVRKSDAHFFLIAKTDAGFALRTLDGKDAGTAPRAEIVRLKPNAGVRRLIAIALVQFTLSDPDPARRLATLGSIAKDPMAKALAPLRAAIESEPDLAIMAQKQRLERLLTLRFDTNSAARVAAINSFGTDLGLDLPAALNPLVASKRVASDTVPPGNIARELQTGRDLDPVEAYELLVAAGLAPARLSPEAQRTALQANLTNGEVGGVALADLDSQAARDRAYTAPEASGAVPLAATDDEVAEALNRVLICDVYVEPDPAVTSAAEAALQRINTRVCAMQVADPTLDGLSLASIHFLAAIGLAITFGVMGVINMAHGEFITIGAYTGIAVQQ